MNFDGGRAAEVQVEEAIRQVRWALNKFPDDSYPSGVETKHSYPR